MRLHHTKASAATRVAVSILFSAAGVTLLSASPTVTSLTAHHSNNGQPGQNNGNNGGQNNNGPSNHNGGQNNNGPSNHNGNTNPCHVKQHQVHTPPAGPTPNPVVPHGSNHNPCHVKQHQAHPQGPNGPTPPSGPHGPGTPTPPSGPHGPGTPTPPSGPTPTPNIKNPVKHGISIVTGTGNPISNSSVPVAIPAAIGGAGFLASVGAMLRKRRLVARR